MRFHVLALSAALCALTPAQAATGRLPDGITPNHYDITVRPDAAKMTFTGSEIIDIDVAKPTTTITLNAAQLSVPKAQLDGVDAATIKLDPAAQTLTLSFATPVTAGSHKLALDFAGVINTSAAGLFALDYKTVDGKDARMIATQFEAPDARRFAPMWDEPSYKATFQLSAVAPKGQTAFSNMPAAKRDVDQASGETLFHFAKTPKMSSYLLFLGMGDVERKTKMVGDVEVGIITRRGVVDQGDFALEAAAKTVTSYNSYFGTPYPLPKLDMIAAPGSSQFFGAMENWGAILYFERRVLIDPKLETESQRQDIYLTVAHEIAHQWFGNLVTMSWWDDLWLNEGFASWMEGKVSDELNPSWQLHTQSVAGGRQGAMNLDARSTTHPIVQKIQTVDQISQAFDSITYQKGEAIIGMLEASLGADAFREGVRNYMAKHAYSSTVTSDLWDELAKSSGKPVHEMMRGFTTQGGVPMVRVGTPRCIAGKTQMTLTQARFGLDAPSRKPLIWKIPVAVGLATSGAANGADTTQQVEVSGPKATPVTLSGCGIPVVNYGQKGYFRTLYSPTHFSVLQDKFAQIGVDDQIGLLADSLAMANADYATIEQHLGLVSAVPVDASPLVWTLIAAQLGGLDDRVKGTPYQAAYRKKVAALLSPVFKQVGWEAKPEEAPAVAQLRERLLPVLSAVGDAGIFADAKAYVAKSFSDPDAVPGPIRLIALNAYSRNIDAAGWDVLHEKAKTEKSPVAQNLYYQALGSAINPKLAQRALDLALTDEAPATLRSGIISSVSDEHPEMAFDWAAKRTKAINALLEDSSKSEFIVGLASGGSDLALAKRVTAYAAANLSADARAPAREAVSFITYRAARKAIQGPAIGRWAKGIDHVSKR